MRNREDDDAVGLHPVEQRKPEPFDDDSARIAARRGAGLRKREGAGCGFLDRCGEARAQAGLRFIVVDDFG